MIRYLKIPESRKPILRKVKKELEDLCNVKIQIDDAISITSPNTLDVLTGYDIIKAIGRGFPPSIAFELLDDRIVLDVIRLKDFGHTQNKIQVIKGRVIGTHGSWKKYLENRLNVKIMVYGNTVSIIGSEEVISIAHYALVKICSGSSHASARAYVEGALEND